MDELVDSAWPVEGLEVVDCCPVCDSRDRSRMYDGLRDVIFECAPGRWSMQACNHCKSAYLDPRPNAASISLAYSRYFTHQAESVQGDGTRGSKLRTRLARGYLNAVYGTQYQDALRVGTLLLKVLPIRRTALDSGLCRHLPQRPHPKARLLDVGCGNGAFLSFAIDAGWDVVGVDSDPLAVTAAQTRGLAVHAVDAQSLPFESRSFDVVTVSHVLEHVHEPRILLKECLRVLVPGGQLWLETPNVASAGHKVFGRAWRDLDPPRHLTIYSREALADVLKEAGFEKIRFRFHGRAASSVWRESRFLWPKCNGGKRAPFTIRLSGGLIGRLLAELFEAAVPSSREFLTCTATRSVAA